MQAEHSGRQLGIPLGPTIGTKSFAPVQTNSEASGVPESVPKVNYIDANRAIFVYYEGDTLPTLEDHFNRSLHLIGTSKSQFQKFNCLSNYPQHRLNLSKLQVISRTFQPHSGTDTITANVRLN